MPKVRPTTAKKIKHAATRRIPGRPAKPLPKLSGSRRRASVEIGEIVRKRAEAEAAIADARKSHERLREAIDILPQGIVFLDADGRYILWNRKYAEIYNRSSDLFKPGVRLEDTIRIGVERGAYPEAIGREEEWIAERLAKLYHPGERHEQILADGRCILIEERLTEDGGIIGLRVDITELKQREASFRLLFDSNPVPMIVCALDEERILGVNDAAIKHYGYSRAEFVKLAIRKLQAFQSEPPWGGDRSSDEQAARTWKHVRADGTLIDLAIYSRHLVYGDRPAVLLALMDITERKRAEARLAFMAQHDGLTGLPNRNLLRQRMDEILQHTRRSADKAAVLVLGSTNSRRSTIRSAMAPATSCCGPSRSACDRRCARKMRLPVSTPMNSRSSRADWHGRKMRCCCAGGYSRRSPIPFWWTDIPSWSAPASASRWRPAMATSPKSC
jgi:PAS domain S-box-containing protein